MISIYSVKEKNKTDTRISKKKPYGKKEKKSYIKGQYKPVRTRYRHHQEKTI